MDEQALQQLAAQLRKPTGEAGIKTGEWMNRGNEAINLDTFKILNAEDGDTILEIGMGNGFFVKEIIQKHNSIKYTGCDFSEAMIAEAEKINTEFVTKGRANFVLSDIASLPFADASFNKIFTINTIYFWEDAKKILSEIKRVLQPKGKFIVALRPKRQMQHYPFIKYGFSLFSKEEVMELLTQNGFTTIQTIENNEPDFEQKGEVMKVQNLIIEAIKS
ncbi:MAG: class I SAM-dependent methyltransferase [Ferruginibacter sp.]